MSEIKTNLYDVLRLKPDCAQEEIRPAYYRQLEYWNNLHAGNEKQLMFGRKIIGAAYVTLGDPVKRREYDIEKFGKSTSKINSGNTRNSNTSKNRPHLGNSPESSYPSSNFFTKIFKEIWSLFRPVIKLGLFIGVVWILFFSDYLEPYISGARENIKNKTFDDIANKEQAKKYNNDFSMNCKADKLLYCYKLAEKNCEFGYKQVQYSKTRESQDDIILQVMAAIGRGGNAGEVRSKLLKEHNDTYIISCNN